MPARQITDPVEFLALSRPFLEKRESFHNLPLGLAHAFAKQAAEGKTYTEEKLRMGVVEKEGRAVAGMLQTPPRHILLWIEPGFEGAAEELKDLVMEKSWDFHGIHGEDRTVDAFAKVCEGLDFEVSVVNIAYELREVIPPRPATGRMRVATTADLDLAIEWMVAFIEEAIGDTENAETRDPEEDRRNLTNWVERSALYLWEDEGPVCMACFTRPMERGVTVSYVYTPPSARGKGYASNLVAEMSQLKLDEGYQWLSLFTDGKNPTSNKIYQRIGYRELGESILLSKV